MTPWKQSVARAFDRADAYDGHAHVQARVAAGLAEAIAGQPLARRPRVLEIGCGTGLLSAALRERVAIGEMLVTDIAPHMVARCRDRLGDAPGLHFSVMDGERPCVAPGFDLIASSLAAQWFEDLPGALSRLARLLAPGGLLALTTLVAGTFEEWAAAHAGTGLAPATPAYPALDALVGVRLDDCVSVVRGERLHEHHRDGIAFLRSLRAIGAGTPASGSGPKGGGALRPVLRAFETGGGSVTYAIATCLVRRHGLAPLPASEAGLGMASCVVNPPSTRSV